MKRLHDLIVSWAATAPILLLACDPQGLQPWSDEPANGSRTGVEAPHQAGPQGLTTRPGPVADRERCGAQCIEQCTTNNADPHKPWVDCEGLCCNDPPPPT